MASARLRSSSPGKSTKGTTPRFRKPEIYRQSKKSSFLKERQPGDSAPRSLWLSELERRKATEQKLMIHEERHIREQLEQCESHDRYMLVVALASRLRVADLQGQYKAERAAFRARYRNKAFFEAEAAVLAAQLAEVHQQRHTVAELRRELEGHEAECKEAIELERQALRDQLANCVRLKDLVEEEKKAMQLFSDPPQMSPFGAVPEWDAVPSVVLDPHRIVESLATALDSYNASSTRAEELLLS